MSLESRVEQLGGEVASVKDELSRTREDLREILSRLGSKTDTADRSAAIPPSPAPKAASRGGIKAPTSVTEGSGSRGGIGLSLDELGLILGQAGPGGPGTGRRKAGFSVEGLARALKAARGRGSSASDVADPRSAALTMPLSDLAEMMKEAQASRRRSVEAPLDASPRSEGGSQASNATDGDAKVGPLPPMGQIARTLTGLLESGQEAANPRPRASSVPTAQAGDKRHSSSEVGTRRTARMASTHERGARPGIRSSVTDSPRSSHLEVAPHESRKAAGIETGERSPVGPKGEDSWSSNLLGSPHGSRGNAPDMRGVDAAGTRSSPVGPTGLTDAEWRAVGPLIPAVKPGGRPSKYERREILNGIVHQMRTGCSWRSLPDDLPPWKIVHHYYRTWREEGILKRITAAPAFRRGTAPEAGWSANGYAQGPWAAGADGSAGKPREAVASGASP